MYLLRSRYPLRTALLLVLSLFAIGFLVGTEQPFVKPVYAKGAVKTTPTDESSEVSKDTKTTETRVEESKPQPRTEEPKREEQTSQPTYSEPQLRDEGTLDTSGQYLKRTERNDPEYRFRRHYIDPFYYAYDFEFYKSYPDYNSGKVVIIDRDTWGDRRQDWRNTYEYQNPKPGSLEEALTDIEATWLERNVELLMWHVDHQGDVDIYIDGKYSHTLSPREMYKLTDEAIQRSETTSFEFTGIDRNGDTAKARARHEYRGPDRQERTAYLTYYLVRTRERWVIDRMDIRKRQAGSPNCFIATAAFGSPMEKDVMVLRYFRDEYLLTNLPGRLFVGAYYKTSPPVAHWIAKHDDLRAMVRGMLWPTIQLCKLLVR